MAVRPQDDKYKLVSCGLFFVQLYYCISVLIKRIKTTGGKNMKSAKRIVYALLFFAILCVLPQVNGAAASQLTVSAYIQKYTDFINDPKNIDGPRWADGVSWNGDQYPKAAQPLGIGCNAYCRDFCFQVYGCQSWLVGGFTSFSNPNEIRAGDIIETPGHVFIVLWRNADNTLYTAEGNYEPGFNFGDYRGYVRISNSAYKISADGKLGTNASISGYHYDNFVSLALTGQKMCVSNQSVTFTIDTNLVASDYSLAIQKDGEAPQTVDCGTNTSYATSFTEPGDYTASVMATTAEGQQTSDPMTFKVIKPADANKNFLFKILPGGQDGVGVVTGFIGGEKDTDITVPSTIDGTFPVTAIADNAFNSKMYINSVTIPEGITNIGAHAFYNCQNLQSVELPGSLASLGASAFEGCKALKAVTIPSSAPLTKISDMTFYDCIQLTAFHCPDAVTDIGEWAFGNDYSLADLTLPDVVKSIGNYAFNHCVSLTTFEIPKAVDTIPVGMLYECLGIKNIEIPSNIKSIGSSAFAQSGIEKIVVPETVTALGNGAFSWNDRLTQADLKCNITALGDGMFYQCHNLVKVRLPDSITSIGDSAFGCNIWGDPSKLSDINIPAHVTRIGSGAFLHCARLMHITIPESVTFIGRQAFYGCTSLNYIALLNKYTVIDVEPLWWETIPTNTWIYGDDSADSTAFQYCQKHPNKLLPLSKVCDFAFLGYMQNLEMNAPQPLPDTDTNMSAYIKTCIKCPVDVYVYDSGNRLVGSVVGNAVTNDVPGYIFIVVSGDEKTVYLPNYDTYHIKLVATGTGTLTYSVTQGVLGTGDALRVNAYDIPLEPGKEMDGHIDPQSCYTGLGDYALTIVGANGQVVGSILPDEELGADAIDGLTVAVMAEAGGTVTDGTVCTKGDSVTVTATPDDGYIFAGWYENGVRILDAGATYRFIVMADRALVAKFTDPHPQISAQPADATVSIGDTASLSVIAAATGKLSYQWYSNAANNTSGGTKISGATESSFTAPTATAGTIYYYCVVTNTDNSVTPGVAGSITSRAAVVTVRKPALELPTPSIDSPIYYYNPSNLQVAIYFLGDFGVTVPAGYSVVDVGFIASKTQTTASTLLLEGSDVTKVSIAAGTPEAYGSITTTQGTTWYARTYITYKDSSNGLTTKYSDVASGMWTNH
jgi:hypothetical protein